jgi:hypothetical protein
MLIIMEHFNKIPNWNAEASLGNQRETLNRNVQHFFVNQGNKTLVKPARRITLSECVDGVSWYYENGYMNSGQAEQFYKMCYEYCIFGCGKP